MPRTLAGEGRQARHVQAPSGETRPWKDAEGLESVCERLAAQGERVLVSQ